jgi:transglutaminase-like putative cysteine protease
MVTTLAIAALVLAGAGAAPAAAPTEASRTFHFKYAATLPPLDPDKYIELWLPLPLESKDQEIEGLHVHAPIEYVVETEPKYGNRMLKVSGTGAQLSGQTVQFHFQATRHAVKGSYDQGEVKKVDTAPDRLVPIDGIIADRAKKSAGDAREPFAIARALYDDVVANLEYDKTGEGWGRGDAIYACSIQKGNCTDFHSLFIGMCRAKNIPARFTIGFPLPPDKAEGLIAGYHCWAEFWVEGKGWVPVDASEARKHPEQKEALFAGLDPNRIEFTRGRDLSPPGNETTGPVNFFVYPYLLVDGSPAEGVKHEFHFQKTAPSH